MAPTPGWGNGRQEFRGYQWYEPAEGETLKCHSLEYLSSKYAVHCSSEREDRLLVNIYENLGCASFEMLYQAQDGVALRRVVTPLAISLNKTGEWGFFALCELRESMRWFRLDRIKEIDPVPLVREITLKEMSIRLLSLTKHEREAILRAVTKFDPELICNTPKVALNGEGMSFIEWAAAIHYTIPDRIPNGARHREWRRHYNAWVRGEDPAEYLKTS